MKCDQLTFDQLADMAESQGIGPSLDFLVEQFRQRCQYYELFEALKMRIRYHLDLPILYGETPDEIDEHRQQQLEEHLLAACREVGSLLVKSGRLQEGWLYLQPLGDREFVRQLIEQTKINEDEDNVDDVIEIGLNQGAAPEFGYRLLLKYHGTCNSITAFDTHAIGMEKPVQRRLATMLVEHLYEELSDNVRHHIEQHESAPAKNMRLSGLIQDRPWLFSDGSHHIDATHLASVVRIARLADQRSAILQAYELAKYGEQLDSDFQYAGHPPFENTYKDHALYFGALLGNDIEAAVEHFRVKADELDVNEIGPIAIENYVELLSRLNKNDEAIRVAVERLVGHHELTGIAPRVFEMAHTADEFSQLTSHFRQQNDLLGFAVGLLKFKQDQETTS